MGLHPFVMCEKNYRDLPDYIRFVHGRWPQAMLSLSFVAASSDVVPVGPALIPRYSDVVPYLREALRIAQECGLWVSPLDSMCGLPLCLWPTALDEPLARADIPAGFDGGSTAERMNADRPRFFVSGSPARAGAPVRFTPPTRRRFRRRAPCARRPWP